MPTPTRKPRSTPLPNKSFNFRLWIEGNQAPVVCQKCNKKVVILKGQAVDLLPLLKEHRCAEEEPQYERELYTLQFLGGNNDRATDH